MYNQDAACLVEGPVLLLCVCLGSHCLSHNFFFLIFFFYVFMHPLTKWNRLMIIIIIVNNNKKTFYACFLSRSNPFKHLEL